MSSSKDGGDDMSSPHIENVKTKGDTKATDKTKEDKSRRASLKLNDLLQSMLKEETTRKTPGKAENLVLTKAKQRKKEKKVTEAPQGLLEAVDNVARELGGDEVRTQSELLNKLVESVESSQKQTVHDAPIVKPTKSHINLSDLIVGMKIDRSKPAPPEVSGRAHQVRQMLEKHQGGQMSAASKGGQPHSVSAAMLGRPQQRRQRESGSPAGLNDGTAFGIFDGKLSTPSEDMWNCLQQRELRLAVTHPAVNIFEEMILWTNQGKLWTFPINNEQGLDEESSVPFSEHVFLEKHLESWCPSRGPVRHFMELVCVGLSKNAYMTVQEKKDHIDWYKEYFNSKQALLQEVGAIS